MKVNPISLNYTIKLYNPLFTDDKNAKQEQGIVQSIGEVEQSQ